MILKINRLFLLIFLILLQSCSGGRVGNFLESSFDNLEDINEKEKKSKIILEKKVNNGEKKEGNKKITQQKKEKKSKIILEKKVNNGEKKEGDKKITKQKKEKRPKSVLEKKIAINRKSEKVEKINEDIKSQRRIKNGLQSYKIIFILKDVDPKDPIEELSTILRNSEVNFEIEKIERFIDSKNKNSK